MTKLPASISRLVQFRSRFRLRCLLIAGLFTTAIFTAGCERESSIDLPYDKAANPYQQLASNTRLASEQDKSILLMFGANWCEDCRRLNQVMRNNTVKPTIDQHFVVMHIDIGNWDHNTDFVEDWGNPTEGGIPAVVVATVGHEVIYKTEPGELATARHKDLNELRAAFEQMAMWHQLYKDDA